MAHAERELDPEEWAAALFRGRPPTQYEVAASLAGAIERGRLQEREACAKLADLSAALDRNKRDLAAKGLDDDGLAQDYEDFAVTAESIARSIRNRTNLEK